MLDVIRQHAQSWAVKVAFGIIILVFVFWGLGNIKSDRSQVLAYVDKKPISMSEFAKGYSRNVDNLRRQNPNLTSEDLRRLGFKRQFFNSLVLSEILKEEATRLGVTVTPVEMQREIAQIPAFQNESKQFDTTRYKALLQANQTSPTEFEGQMQQELMRRKIENIVGSSVQVTEAEARDMYDYAQEQTRIDYVLFDRAAFEAQINPTPQEIEEFWKSNPDSFKDPARIALEYVVVTPEALARKVSVSDEDIKAYYEARKDRFVQQEQVKARHILIRVNKDAPEAEDKKAQEQIQKFAAQIQKGEKFDELARKNSQSPDSVQGGDLGWFGRGDMVKPFEDVAFSLKAGQVSGPVRTDFGWHLIKVEERREPGQRTLDQVQGEIRKTLAEERAAEAMTGLVDGFTERVASGADVAAVAADYGLPPEKSPLFSKQEGLKDVAIGDEGMNTLFALPDGATTEMPVTLETGYLFAKKIESKPESVKPLDQVKAQVVKELKAQGAMKMAEAKATEALAKLQAGNSKDLQIKQSELFGRRGVIAGLGMNPELVEDAFKSEPEQWLGKPYQVSSGFVLARPGQRVPVGEERWAKEKDNWLKLLAQNKRSEMFQAYTSELLRKAKIEVVQPRVLDE